MKTNLLYPMLALVALAVWIKPDQPEAAARRPAAPLEAPARVDVAETVGARSGQASLPQATDGHYYADVSVEGASAHMLVDTGASVIALTGEDAEAAGLTWQADDVKPVAQGANGPVSGVRVKLGRVQLRDIEVHDVDAIVVPEGLGISLLGQSFLSRAGRLEIDNGRMVLGA